jgi:hypothetical protein
MTSNISALELQEALNALNGRIHYLESTRTSSNPSPKICLPEKFDGTISKYRDFIVSIENIFVLNGDRYPSDEIKVRFIGTLLSRDALAWFRGLVECNSELLKSYGKFMDEFKLLFDDPLKHRHARAAIDRLKQGEGSVLTYASKFRRLASDTGYNNDALTEHFRKGLNDEVKDVLSTSLDEPSDIESLIPYCIRIDNRLYDRRMERSGTRGNSRGNFRATSGPSTGSSSNSPMDLDALKIEGKKKLTSEERERRIQNKLCLYCGEAGHRLAQCPRKN